MREIDTSKYKVVEIDKDSARKPDHDDEFDYYETREKRYMVVGAETGEVIDNAQGWGFKTKKNAYAALYYRLNKASVDKKKKTVKKWLREHKDFAADLEDACFDAIKDGHKISGKEVEEFARIKQVELPCNGTALLKYM